MNCIAAVDSNWAIGIDNRLLFHIPQDLRFFKEKTVGKTVIMGKNTLLSLPEQKPLANRRNIVLSTSLKENDFIVCKDLKSLFEKIKDYDSDELFVIGGEQIYRLLLPYCSTAYITRVNAEKPANRFFNNLDLSENWEMTYKGETQIYNGIEFCFCEYRNTQPK
ncbi:MAG: dihydrofolate reductase [Ruminococcus sp.]